MPQPLVVVFDTSVLIPLAVPTGRSRSTRLLNRLRVNGHLVAISPQIHDEVTEKLRTKQSLREWLEVSDEGIERFLKNLSTMLGRRVKGKKQLSGVVKADPKDDKIIAAAVEANASYIVSEDPHLLDLQEYEGIRIMSREAFMAELDRLGMP